MCAICHSNPCHYRCPNAPEPIAIDDCFLCGDPIREGEEYFTFKDTPICSRCVKNINIENLLDVLDMSPDEIILELGGERKIGEAD